MDIDKYEELITKHERQMQAALTRMDIYRSNFQWEMAEKQKEIADSHRLMIRTYEELLSEILVG